MPTPPNKLFAATVRGTVAWVQAIGAHPISVLCVVIAVVVMSLLNVGMSDSLGHLLAVALVASVAGFFGTMALELDLRRSFPIWRMRALFALLLLGIIAGVFWPLPTEGLALLYPAGIWIGALAILFVAVTFRLPFEMNRPNADVLAWYSGQRFLVGAIAGILVSALVGAILTGILMAFESWLEIPVIDAAYREIWILAMGLLAPITVMGAADGVLPVNTKRRMPAPTQPPRWLRLLVNGVMIPVAMLATLAAYGLLAMAITGAEVPVDSLAAAIAGALIFGAVTHLAALPLAYADHPLAARFRRLYPFVMLLPLVGLIWALWVRIGAYGVTEPRFLMGIVAGWLTLMALMWIPGLRVSPARLAGVLGALLLLVGGGPWGAATVSLNSQTKQLMEILRAHDMLTEVDVPEEERTDPMAPKVIRTAHPAPEGSVPSVMAQERIIDILAFFQVRGQADYIGAMFPNDPEDATVADRVAALNLDPALAGGERQRLSVTVAPARVGLSTAGYDSMLPFILSVQNEAGVDVGDGRSVRLSGETVVLVEGEDATPLVTLDLAPVTEAILAEQETPFAQADVEVTPDYLEADAEGQSGWRLRVLANGLTVVEQDGTRTLSRLDGILLLGEPME